MEHNAENKNYNNNESLYESCVQSLDAKLQAEGVLAAVNAMGVNGYSRDTLETLGQLLKSAVMASPDVTDKHDSVDAQEAFLRGTVTGLLVAQESLDSSLTPARVIASVRTLCDKGEDGRVSNRQVWQEGESHYEQLCPQVKSILERWADACNASGARYGLYTVGFGLVMGGAERAAAELELFTHLEASSEWDMPAKDRSIVALQSLDADCVRLAACYQKYLEQLDLPELADDNLTQGLAWLASMVSSELGKMADLQIDDCLQTRGDGLCLLQNDDGVFADFQSVSDESVIRGKFTGIDIVPVPTEYALIVQDYEDEGAFEPVVCLIFEDVESVGVTGEAMARDGMVAIPMRVGGVHIDRVIFQAEK